MDWTAIGQASALGLVQGLTEYLPVSSSGHLAIGAHFFGLTSRLVTRMPSCVPS